MKTAIQAKELTKSEEHRSLSNDGETFQFAAAGGHGGVIVSASQPLDVTVGDDSVSGKRLGIPLTVPVPEEDEKLSYDVHLVRTKDQRGRRFGCESCEGFG